VVDPVFGALLRPSVVDDGWEDAGYPHGTLLLARRECLLDIGLFDERYFAYCEEADLGERARRALAVEPMTAPPDAFNSGDDLVVLEPLPTDLVYAGMSMGCGYAAWLALRERPGARGVLYLFGAVDPAWFEADWPEGLPAVAHQALDDPWREAEGDDGFRARVPGGELVDYRGSGHLFLDDSTEDYDAEAAQAATAHILAWLAALS